MFCSEYIERDALAYEFEVTWEVYVDGKEEERTAEKN